MAGATAADLRAWLRLPEAFTDDETATAELLLGLARGVIEEEAGQLLESSTDTVVLDGPTVDSSPYQSAARSPRLVLPRWPVTAVHTVTEDGEELTHGPAADYTWSASGILTRRGACWPSGDQVVEVTYTAGFLVMPTGLKRIELRLAAAGWTNPELLASESLGDHSRSFAAELLGMELTKAELRTIAAYRART
ncbi:hypothetical protein AW27_023580 [Streptomyces sp. PCS3-D2]|uniref:hypothetical protein n=1 Tax=Streptomyces sp. PCS3-D2 TaxID=1460244 RepID=UPI0004507641|nr:hypothetical protein [Streptomyces sp. PCS3-D2]WKV74226.1 hypothetical protein AW27_023580 [Streptomyces sp. PCS3-D2]